MVDQEIKKKNLEKKEKYNFMMHFLVQQAQEPLLLPPLVVQLSTCLNPTSFPGLFPFFKFKKGKKSWERGWPQPVFLVLYGPSAREEELNQFHSLSATTAR